MPYTDPLLTKSTVSELLHCSERTLERLVRCGGFPAPLRHGKDALWFESVVHQWLQRQREAQMASMSSPVVRGSPGALHHPALFAMAPTGVPGMQAVARTAVGSPV